MIYGWKTHRTGGFSGLPPEKSTHVFGGNNRNCQPFAFNKNKKLFDKY